MRLLLPLLLLFLTACRSEPETTNEAFPEWVGKALPPFTLVDLSGDTVRSADLRGRVVVINGWFTTCAPCLEEMPRLNAIRELYAGQDIAFLGMALDEAATIEAFLQRRDFDFRLIPDADAYINQFGEGFPKNIFVDKRGVIRYTRGAIPRQISKRHPGGELDEREFYAIIGELLKEN